MNWLLYVGGWFIGIYILGAMNNDRLESAADKLILIISWTMLWIGLCWRFV